MAWLSLVNLNLLHMLVLSRRQEVIAELDIRVDSHAATPDIYLVSIGQGHTVVVANANILNEGWTA